MKASSKTHKKYNFPLNDNGVNMLYDLISRFGTPLPSEILLETNDDILYVSSTTINNGLVKFSYLKLNELIKDFSDNKPEEDMNFGFNNLDIIKNNIKYLFNDGNVVMTAIKDLTSGHFNSIQFKGNRWDLPFVCAEPIIFKKKRKQLTLSLINKLTNEDTALFEFEMDTEYIAGIKNISRNTLKDALEDSKDFVEVNSGPDGIYLKGKGFNLMVSEKPSIEHKFRVKLMFFNSLDKEHYKITVHNDPVERIVFNSLDSNTSIVMGPLQ